MSSMQQAFLEFAKNYQERFIAMVRSWDVESMAKITQVLADARARGNQVLVAGNGGSAAIANHLECDATKGTCVAGHPVLMSRSLSANGSMVTALGNDIGFDSVFEKQVDYYARPGDVVLLISSSGNSPNVVNACKKAKARGLTTVAFVGFKGGALKELADHVLHIPIENYGIAEDMHQATMHLITQFLAMTWSEEARNHPR
ncbi:MAG: SIS domain-containing protein [Myxococcota bacterium]